MRLLGQEFRSDLVAQQTHHVAIRANEHDAQLAAKVGKFGVLGDKAPSYPDGVGARCGQGPSQPGIIDVTALGLLRARVDDLSGAEKHRLIRLTDEHGMTVGLGEESDRAQGGAVLLIELAHRVDEAHGGFTAVYDRYALEFVGHQVPHAAAPVLSAAPASTLPGSATVR